ncbi:MAG: phenylalanine--tRNA ligase subunit beta [Dehalococcoidales bacterium]|nr:phenylalanine--tRNA ligase subunit beta [Dehalococcoidales bacterium]
MRISIKWLKDYLDINISPDELAGRLMMSGNEVKAIEKTGADWHHVVIGQITAVNAHPNADRLRLATVTTGQEEHTVVCGAPNLNIGDRIVFATVGAELNDGHTGQKIRLKPAKIRGVESKGMICSEMELGISQNHEGILVLPADAPLGAELCDYLGDTIIDLDVTPNRPDCLSMTGIAREASALTGSCLHIPDVNYNESDDPVENYITIEIQAPDLCPRYCATLIKDITIRPSPQWMQERLVASGMRPINNIVDISNYVMLEYGQPLHTFDYDKINGKKIIVRRAAEGERLVSLDRNERHLNPDMLVIADQNRSVAIAGVMGGANSDVTEGTKNILLEAASFNPVSIHYTGDTLGLQSESRYRFERGISSGLALPALKRATQLLAELGSGTVARGWMDVCPFRKDPKPVQMSFDKARRLMGMEYSREQILTTLSALGFENIKEVSPGKIEVNPPYWRSDIHREVDLIEEVSRIIGYDKIPYTLLAEPLPHLNPDPIFDLKRSLKIALTAEGYSEILTFSLTGREALEKAFADRKLSGPEPLRVVNPMTDDMAVLRTSLRPALLSAFASNRRFTDDSIRLFETGKVYLPSDKGQPDERETLCAVVGGLRFTRSWQDKEGDVDFFDAKGSVEGLLYRSGLEAVFEKSRDGGLHINKQADILVRGQKVGSIGEVHPVVRAAFDIAEPVYLWEIDLKTLVTLTSAAKNYRPVARFPSIVRDLALVVDSGTTHQSVKTIIEASPLVEQVEIFDVYSGEQLPEGKKSLAYRISYRSDSHTLTDEEVNHVQKEIVARLKNELEAILRG